MKKWYAFRKYKKRLLKGDWMKVNGFLSLSQKIRQVYGKLCRPVLLKYGLSQVSFDVLMFVSNAGRVCTAQEISEGCDMKKIWFRFMWNSWCRVGICCVSRWTETEEKSDFGVPKGHSRLFGKAFAFIQSCLRELRKGCPNRKSNSAIKVF